MKLSESAGFEVEPRVFIDAEHQIHVLHGLAAGALEQVVDDAGDEELVIVFFHMNEGFVGVHHLLQVEVAIYVMCESSRLIELLVEFHNICLRHGGVDAHDLGAEDAAGEVATIRDEIHAGIEAGL